MEDIFDDVSFALQDEEVALKAVEEARQSLKQCQVAMKAATAKWRTARAKTIRESHSLSVSIALMAEAAALEVENNARYACNSYFCQLRLYYLLSYDYY